MPRRAREDAAGTIHHVTTRGNNRTAIVRDDADRMAFLRRLRLTVERFELVLHAYCLMDNHVHLVLQRPSGTLGEPVRFLCGGYAHSFNRRHGRTGHLFEGPFDSRPIASESYLLTAVAYDVLNPVRAGICAHPVEYAWSSYRTMVGRVTAPTVEVSPFVLDLLAQDRETARRVFAQYVSEQAALWRERPGSG